MLKLQVLHATLSKLLQSEFGWGEVTVFYSLHKHLSQSVCSGFWKPLWSDSLFPYCLFWDWE